jgi:hypothetical protein
MKILRFLKDCWVEGVFYATNQPVAFGNPPSADLIANGDAIEVTGIGCWTDHDTNLGRLL